MQEHILSISAAAFTHVLIQLEQTQSRACNRSEDMAIVTDMKTG